MSGVCEETPVLEIRCDSGYGLRWLINKSHFNFAYKQKEDIVDMSFIYSSNSEVMFRGCLEPVMENGHLVGWRHGDK